MLVVGGDTPIGRPPASSGTYSARADAHPSGDFWSTSGSSSDESTRSLRPRWSTRPVFEPPSQYDADHGRTRWALAVGRGDAEMPPSSSGSAITRARRRSARPAGCDQLEERLELGLRCERVADLAEGLQLAQPACRRLVQPRVLDRHRRLCREQVVSSSSSSVKSARPPSRSGTGSRTATPRSRIGTPRNTASAGGVSETRRREGRRQVVQAQRCASWIRTPRIPRPCGRSPIRHGSRHRARSSESVRASDDGR